jgi:UDPglucose--hexose-1-phosphate uridylyltransferase
LSLNTLPIGYLNCGNLIRFGEGMQNELRKSYDTKDWALLSQIEPSSVGCGLCPVAEDKTEETYRIEDDKGHWLTRSIVDPYPFTHPSMFKIKENTDFLKSFYAHGWSEIVTETRDHTKELHDLTSDEIKNVLMIYINRINALRIRENVEFIGIIKDNLHIDFNHAYSRIFTLPITPELVKNKINIFNDYMFKNEKCAYCELLKHEKESPRLIMENESFVVTSPFAQRNSYECCILPKKHYNCISELNEFEIFTLAETIKSILTRMSVVLSPFRYGIAFYLRPNNEKDFHFHIDIFQKTLQPSLKEGYGINLCKLTPENTAKILRGK